MFIAVTNDGGFYHIEREEDAAKMADIFEFDFNKEAFNIFEIPESIVCFTGIDYTKEYKDYLASF